MTAGEAMEVRIDVWIIIVFFTLWVFKMQPRRQGLISSTISLLMHLYFGTFLCHPMQNKNINIKWPNLRYYGEHEHTTVNFPFNIWQIEHVLIIPRYFYQSRTQSQRSPQSVVVIARLDCGGMEQIYNFLIGCSCNKNGSGSDRYPRFLGW